MLTEIQKIIYEPGIYDISNSQYHEADGISRSAISELAKSPLHYWDAYLNPIRRFKESTPSMKIGSAVHTMLLEPHLLDLTYAVKEKVDGRTKQGKEYNEFFYSRNEGKTILTDEEYKTALAMTNSVAENSRALLFMENAQFEKSFFWRDKETGFLLKARPDIINAELGVIAEVKSAMNSSQHAFKNAIMEHNYHIQAAMQLDAIEAITGIKYKHFVFIVIQNNAPHDPELFELDDDKIEHGRREYKDALKVLKECIRTNDWKKEREKVKVLHFADYHNRSSFSQLKEIYNVE